MIPAGICVFHPNQLKIVVFAYLVLLPVAFFYNLVGIMFFSIQFYGKNRVFLPAGTLVNDKIKAAGIKQPFIRDVIRENL